MVLRLALLLFLATHSALSFTIEALPDTVPVPWKTSVSITCSWDPAEAGAEAEFVVDSTSIYSSSSPYDLESGTSRAEQRVDMAAGEAVLVIR